MRKLVVGTFVTVDGVMQAPGGPNEDREGGFEHGGWSVNFWDETMGGIMDKQMERSETLLLGRKTYEIFAAHWPNVTDENDSVARKLNTMRKYVVSRTLKTADWTNSTLISHDVPASITRLKQEPGGEIHVSGSGNLIQTLLKHDLVDEFDLWVFPVVIGTGKRLFGEGTMPGAFQLKDAKTASTGVAIYRYERAGKIPYGTFEVDQAGSTSELWTKDRS